MSKSSVRQRVLSGKTVAGSMVFEFFSPGVATVLNNSGCEYIIYDMEHTGLSLESFKIMAATCRGLPVEPMIRVPGGDYTFVARALDVGARGVMIPMVESVEQAMKIASACRYPPIGRRGAAFGFAHDDYASGSVVDKILQANENTLVIAQIETERGLANLEAIAAVQGIDVLWLGHFDLTNFLGIPGQFDHPDFQRALERIAQIAKSNNKAAGFMATDNQWIKRVSAAGYTMIAVGTDMGILGAGTSALIESVNNSGTHS